MPDDSTPPRDTRQFSFTKITIDRTPAELRRCDTCMAIVITEDAQAHAQWHGTLTREVRTAGGPFGNIGGLFGGVNL